MTNKDVEINNAKINTINYLNSYDLDVIEHELLQSIITYLYTEDYDLFLEVVKSYLLNNNKLSKKEFKSLLSGTPLFDI